MSVKPSAGRRPPNPPAELKPDRKQDLYSIKRAFERNANAFGQRELNKFDKLRRISAAAREQFASKGYEGTTLRDIAQEAGVALGTVGFYAENKQELVLLIFNEDMSDLIEHRSEPAVYTNSLIDALISLVQPLYTVFSQQTALYRTLLRENVFSASSQHAVEFQRHRGVLIAQIAGLFGAAEAAGEVRSELDLDLAGRTVFFVLFAAVRWWIAAENPAVEPGLRELRRMLTLLVDGARAHSVPHAAG